MRKAKDFEVLRSIKPSGIQKIPMPRKPLCVATLIDEVLFNSGHYLAHNKTVFLEDRYHDWDWSDGQFTYYTRVTDLADVVVVYSFDDDS